MNPTPSNLLVAWDFSVCEAVFYCVLTHMVALIERVGSFCVAQLFVIQTWSALFYEEKMKCKMIKIIFTNLICCDILNMKGVIQYV